MKLCHITDALPGYHAKWGGAEQACYEILKLLKEKGHEITVCTAKTSENKSEFNIHEIKTMEDYLGDRAGLIKLLIPFDPVAFLSSYFTFKKNKPDIIHLHSFRKLSFSIISAAKLLHIPSIYSIYDYWPFCPIQILSKPNEDICMEFHGARCRACLKSRKYSFIQSFFAIFRKTIFDHFINKVDSFIVLSNHSAKVLEEYGISKEKINIIVLAPGIVSKIENQSKMQVEKNSILFIGWIERHKGLHIIIHAMPNIISKIPSAKLYILGIDSDENYKKQLLSFIEDHGFKNTVAWFGRMPQKEKDNFLKKADVIVIPEQWINMSPVLLMESMALGKTVVASKIGGIPEFIEDQKSGFLAEPKSSDDFAQKILFALGSGKESSKIGKNAQKRFDSIFNEDIVYTKLNSIYEREINEH